MVQVQVDYNYFKELEISVAQAMFRIYKKESSLQSFVSAKKLLEVGKTLQGLNPSKWQDYIYLHLTKLLSWSDKTIIHGVIKEVSGYDYDVGVKDDSPRKWCLEGRKKSEACHCPACGGYND